MEHLHNLGKNYLGFFITICKIHLKYIEKTVKIITKNNYNTYNKIINK